MEEKSPVQAVAAALALVLVIVLGTAFLRNLATFGSWSTLMLLVILCALVARLFADLREARPDQRLCLTRTSAAALAAFFAVLAVSIRPRWASGAAIWSASFAFLLEILRQFRSR